ncbi:MAG: hypothetical protein JZU55_04885, partial [Afipia sp.]|nr:hypothetical protein [Afipia sp.]
ILFDRRRRETLFQLIESAHSQDSFIDDLSVTSFGDKVKIVDKLSEASEDRQTMLADLKEAQKLRNSLAHAKHYAASPKEAARVCQLVRRIEVLEVREDVMVVRSLIDRLPSKC